MLGSMLSSSVAFQPSKRRRTEPLYPDGEAAGPDIRYYSETYGGRYDLSPMLWIHLFSFLNVNDQPVGCSCFFAELCEDDDLWKRFCIRVRKAGPLVYRSSWKRTGMASSSRTPSLASMAAPLQDLLTNFAGFNLRSVQEVEWEDMTAERFHEEFAAPRQPVLVKGALSQVLQSPDAWSKQSLLHNHAARCFQCVCQEPGTSRHRLVSMQLGNYLEYAGNNSDLEPLYLFDGALPGDLQNAVNPPAFLGSDASTELVGRTKFFEERRWLAVGGAGSGARMHVDPIETSAWNLVVEGQKHWVLLPPDAKPLSSEGRDEGALIAPGAALWFHNVKQDGSLSRRLHMAAAMEVRHSAGDLLFVPNGWWHCTLNLEPTVAYTENCIIEANLPEVQKVLGKVDVAAAQHLQEITADWCRRPARTNCSRRDSGWHAPTCTTCP